MDFVSVRFFYDIDSYILQHWFLTEVEESISMTYVYFI